MRLAALLTAAGVANDTVDFASPDLFVCFEVGGAYRGLKEWLEPCSISE